MGVEYQLHVTLPGYYGARFYVGKAYQLACDFSEHAPKDSTDQTCDTCSELFATSDSWTLRADQALGFVEPAWPAIAAYVRGFALHLELPLHEISLTLIREAR